MPLLAGWELEEAVEGELIHPPLRATIEVARFKAYYMNLVAARQGDYKLALGIPHDQKNIAWGLSDYDGHMLEVIVNTVRRARGEVIPSIADEFPHPK